MYPGGNDPNNVAQMAQLLKNPQYLTMLANMNNPMMHGHQPTLVHHPTAGTTITPNTLALIRSAAMASGRANVLSTTTGTTTANINPNSANNGVVNNNNNTNGAAVSKWHDDLSRNTRQELFNTIVEIKTGKSFNGDKSSIDGNLSKSILNQISKIWKQTNSKEQFAHELSQWLATENTGVSETEIEKKLLELMNKPQQPQQQQPQQQKPSSSVGVENLFGMMTSAASTIGTNSSFPNITNPINSAKNSNGGTATTNTSTTTTTTTTSNTNTSTTTSTAVNINNNGIPPPASVLPSSTNNTGTAQPTPKKISPQDIEKYLGFADFLKQHEDMIRQYIRSVASQHAELTKRIKTFATLPPEEQMKLKTSMQKNQMILAESKALDKILSLTTREERVKLLENLTQKSFAFAVHIKEVIEKKLKPVKTDAAQPPTAPPVPATNTNTTGNNTTVTSAAVSTNSSTGNASTTAAVPDTNQPSNSSSQAASQKTGAVPINPPSVPPSTHKKELGDDGFFNLKKVGESSLVTFNQDSFYSALGEMNIKNLTHSTKRKLIPESTEHEKVLKRVKTPIDILQNNLTNLIEFDNIIEFKNTINIKLIEDARYQLDFIINPIEKGILNLPILTLCVIVNHNEIIPYSISFSQNYANEKNSIFVNIRKYFNNLLIENTTSFINTSDLLSTQNNTYHIQRYNLSLNCILNSWITSINNVVKKELQ